MLMEDANLRQDFFYEMLAESDRIFGTSFFRSIIGNKNLSGYVSIDDISPIEFEFLVLFIFEKNNYTVKPTPPSNDSGIDGFIYDEFTRSTAIIQIKQYRDSAVGREDIQKLVGAAAGRPNSKLLFATSGLYSKSAMLYAEQQNITLYDKNWIEYHINNSEIKKIDLDLFILKFDIK